MKKPEDKQTKPQLKIIKKKKKPNKLVWGIKIYVWIKRLLVSFKIPVTVALYGLTLFALFRIFSRIKADGNTMILICVFLRKLVEFFGGLEAGNGMDSGWRGKQSEEKVFLFEWEVTDPLRDD